MKTTSKFKLDAETLKEYIVSFRISKEQAEVVEKWTPKFGPLAKLDFSSFARHEKREVL
jgi:hypothetical protein